MPGGGRGLTAAVVAATAAIALAGCGSAAIPRSAAEVRAEASFLGTAPPVALTTMPPTPPPLTMVAIGDAYTSGTSYGGLGAKGWVQQVGAALGWKTVNLSAPGDGYKAKGTDGEVFSQKLDQAAQANPQVMLVWGARNDVPERLTSVTDAVRSLFDALHARLPNAVVVIIGPSYQTADAPRSYTKVRDAERTAAAAHGFLFIDPIAENWFGGAGLMNSDNVHPTDAGFVHMSQLLERDLTTLQVTKLAAEHAINPSPTATASQTTGSSTTAASAKK